MNIVFDVFVNGKMTETIRPNKSRLRDLQIFIAEEAANLIRKYGNNVYLSRRVEY
ncbi:mechanosensitive ion channel protein MscL [Paenibacillus sp. GSMTC-2017]|uniref:mechanosensitive ion channel protein MscL n=1 Tax=Paenibacillus sp. GSMTC-2017 TaxID=2794350 RepID=UPI0018DA2448|nr:mechanosensitive ion channel protein MscL [Paenibacillus sp. GSMTC-2017]MBH5318040.1 mechanosensitive ion channel protein MscL [Paenibacillus sp. GSMTC-2017]